MTSSGSSGCRRGRYGIDGGNIAVPFCAAVQAGLAGTAWWAARHHKRAVAGLAGLASVAAAAAGYLYSTGPGKRAVWAELLDELALHGDKRILRLVAVTAYPR